MSYLNISQAAWSLVLSKDPHIKAKPAAPEAAAEDSGLQEKLYLQHGVQAAVPAATTQPAASQQHSSDPTRLGGSIITAGLRSSVVLQSQGKDAAGFPTASKGTASGSSNASRSPRKPSQQQRQGDNLAVLAGDESTLPLELHTGAAPTQRQAPPAWSPSSGEQPSKWLAAAHGPTWQAEAAAAARPAAAAHRQLLGQLEQRRAALLKELGRTRDLDLKQLLQQVASYTDDVQALLAAGQQSALHAQQEHYHRLTAAAAAAVDGSIEAALEAAHRAHQERLSLVQQSAAAKLEAARLTATQQLAAALKLQSQQAQQQLEWQVSGLNEHWSSRCKAAEAAVEKEGALRAHAESECTKLRAELALAKREATNWRTRWEKDCAVASGSSNGTSGVGGGANCSFIGSADGTTARAGSGLSVAFDVGGLGPSRRTSVLSTSG